MTFTKESLREAREYLQYKNVTTDEVTLETAAGFVERLLPEQCPICKGTEVSTPCAHCHGSGQLWDEGLIEVVAKALYVFEEYPVSQWEIQSDRIKDQMRAMARAVLAALTQEVGK